MPICSAEDEVNLVPCIHLFDLGHEQLKNMENQRSGLGFKGLGRLFRAPQEWRIKWTFSIERGSNVL